MTKLYKLDISKKKMADQETTISRKSTFGTTDSETIDHLLNNFKYDPNRAQEVLSKYEHLTEMGESQNLDTECQKVPVTEPISNTFPYGKRQRTRKCFKKK